uniref:Uncharacterized protein n=1 Tax=Peronospora matthiolae TaxID=2874970 RepID=A0AAV1TLI2_9STRA
MVKNVRGALLRADDEGEVVDGWMDGWMDGELDGDVEDHIHSRCKRRALRSGLLLGSPNPRSYNPVTRVRMTAATAAEHHDRKRGLETGGCWLGLSVRCCPAVLLQ